MKLVLAALTLLIPAAAYPADQLSLTGQINQTVQFAKTQTTSILAAGTALDSNGAFKTPIANLQAQSNAFLNGIKPGNPSIPTLPTIPTLTVH